jgi:hypothetical protein
VLIDTGIRQEAMQSRNAEMTQVNFAGISINEITSSLNELNWLFYTKVEK